jgi:hypothetical protein
MNLTRSDIEGKPSRIETPQGHKPPKAIRKTPKRDLEGFVIEEAGDPKALLERYNAKMAKRTKDAKQPKQTVKEKVMSTIFTRIWAFIRDVILQWAFPFPIYKKGADGVTPVVDPDTGKYVIDWIATVSTRVLSLVVVLWGTVEFLGISVAEWIERIRAAVGG